MYAGFHHPVIKQILQYSIAVYLASMHANAKAALLMSVDIRNKSDIKHLLIQCFGGI